MAIGTLAAIGLGLAGAGGVASAISSNKAAGKAADIAQNTADQNNALTRDIYAQNKQALAPFMQRGNVAGDYLNAMLGLPSNNAGSAYIGTQNLQPQLEAYGGDTGMVNDYGLSSDTVDAFKQGGFTGMMALGASLPWAQRLAAQRNGQAGIAMQGGNAPAIGVRQPTQQDAQNAFANYLKNSDYGFQFANGSNAVNSGYAGAGSIKSGAAMKAMEQFRQNLQAGYRGEYMNALGNQQGTGLSGANALAGVSTQFGNTISGNNNSAATAAANAALYKGSNGFGNTLSLIGGGLYGYGR